MELTKILNDRNPLCVPNNLSRMSGNSDIHPATKRPRYRLFRLIK